MISLDWEWYVHVKMIITIPRKMLLRQFIHGQNGKRFFHWQSPARPRKIQMFRPANWNYTFVESWVAFFQIYLTQSVLAPLKCLTTNMESAEIDRKWLTEKYDVVDALVRWFKSPSTSECDVVFVCFSVRRRLIFSSRHKKWWRWLNCFVFKIAIKFSDSHVLSIFLYVSHRAL